MSSFNSWRSGTALLTALSLTAGAAAPLVIQAPVQAQTSFFDVQSSYWAAPFIQELARREIISGFPDGSFRPDDPVTRAQFAAMVRRAFDQAQVRNPVNFVDVPSNYWAYEAIREAYTIGFLTGYPGNVFNPNQNIPRAQVLVSLANGLGYTASGSVGSALQIYSDSSSIPEYAQTSIAAATQEQIVVNYPNTQVLNPNRPATRAEVAAFIYQALVSSGDAVAVSSPYIVGQTPVVQPNVRIPSGTVIPVGYEDADKIYVSPEEPDPVPVTLLVDRDIISADGTVLIPANSQVIGEVRIAGDGAQFYAEELVLTNGSRLAMDATSRVVTTTEVIRRGASVREVITGAALGAGAAAAVAGVTGDRAIATEEVLGGVGAGALLNFFLGRDRATLISIDPNTDLDLTLNSPLALR
jgi:hypothetical protein